MREDRLPFNIQESKKLSTTGGENEIERMQIKGKSGAELDMILKESKFVALADDAEMQRLKSTYEFMKNDPDFGRFVIDTNFVKAQRNATEPAKAYLVQKFIPGRRIDEISNKEIYGNKTVAAELLQFVRAAILMLEKTKSDPQHKPDFNADTKTFLGKFLHNPRFSGNILVADSAANLPQQIYFVDTGAVFGPGFNESRIEKLRRPLDNKLQLIQLKRWASKLEQTLAN